MLTKAGEFCKVMEVTQALLPNAATNTQVAVAANTGNSTETELIGIDDALKHIMWGL